jgi:hypothetical protein
MWIAKHKNPRAQPDKPEQWLSEKDESLEDLKTRMKKAGSNPAFYDFTEQ